VVLIEPYAGSFRLELKENLMARAVNFAGTNYLINRYMGTFQFPAAYYCGNISYWYKASAQTNGVILVGFSLTRSEHQIRIMRNPSDGVMKPSLGLQNGNSSIVGRIDSGVPYDDRWHNIIWAWNTNASGNSPWIINSTLDGTPVSVNIINLGSSASGFSVDYGLTDQWVIGSEAGLGSDYVGCLAELFMYVSNTDYTGITTTPTYSSFITNPDQNGKVWPLDLGVNGSAVFNALPQIYLRGDRTTFPLNHGAATAFTQVPAGSLNDCSDDPFPIRASFFDGNTYLQNDATLAGLPDESPYGLVSFWYCLSALADNAVGDTPIIRAAQERENGNVGDPLYIFFDRQGYLFVALTTGVFYLPPRPNGDEYVTLGYVYSLEDPLPVDGKWHHVLLSWDMNSQLLTSYVDNLAVSAPLYEWYSGDPNGQQGPFTIKYSGFEWQIGASRRSGNANSAYYPGKLAEVFVLIGTYTNVDDPDVRAKFINPDGTAADIAANGATPFGEDTLPQIYLSGDSGAFPLNLPNNTFSQVFDTGSAAYSFYVPNGSNALQDAVSDPFGSGPLDGEGGLPMALGDGPLGSAYIPKTVGPLNDASGLPASIGSRPIPQ